MMAGPSWCFLAASVLLFTTASEGLFVRVNPDFQKTYLPVQFRNQPIFFIVNNTATVTLQGQFASAILKFDETYSFVEMDWTKPPNEIVYYHMKVDSTDQSVMKKPTITIPENGTVDSIYPKWGSFNTSMDCIKSGIAALEVELHFNVTSFHPNPMYNQTEASLDENYTVPRYYPRDEGQRKMDLKIQKKCVVNPPTVSAPKSSESPESPKSEGSGGSLSDEAMAGIIVGSLVAVCFVLFIVALNYCQWKKREREMYEKMQRKESEDRKRRMDEMEKNFDVSQRSVRPYQMTSATTDGYREDERSKMQPLPAEEIGQLMNLIRKERGSELESFIIPRDAVTIGKEIGRGAFGKVLVGCVRQGDGEEDIPVAIKTLKYVVMPSDITEFLEEALVMKDFKHINVVALVGVCMEGNDPPMVCLEFMHYGDLRSFLRRSRGVDDSDVTIEDQLPPLTAEQLVDFCIAVANGMAYLARRGFVHRDLATRNCMINQDRVVKIGDFGLARDIHEDNYYRMGTARRLPVKWMAYESLVDQVFTSMSDVWSYGVVMWEIFTLGQSPYPGVANHEILEHLELGYRLTLPEWCLARDIYPIMASCWSKDKRQRPTFEDLSQRLMEYRDNFYVNVAVRGHEDKEYQNINPKIQAIGRGESMSGYSLAGSIRTDTSSMSYSGSHRYVSEPRRANEHTEMREPSPAEEMPNPGYHFVQPIVEEGGNMFSINTSDAQTADL